MSSSKATVHSLLNNAYKSRVNDLKSSIDLSEQALAISKKLEDRSCIGKSLSQLSLFHLIIGDFDLSVNMAKEAIEHFEATHDEKGIADAKYTIAGALYKTNDYNLGLTYLMECLQTYKKLDDHHNQACVEKSIGTIYEFFGDVDSAIKLYKYSIESAKKANDLDLQSNAFNPLSGIYLNKGKVKVAMELIEKSITFKKKTNDISGRAFALYGRGKIFTVTAEFEKAESDFLEAEKIHTEMGEKLGLAMSLHKRGVLYIRMKRLEEAKDILIKALEYSNKHRIILIKFKANLLLHEIAKMEKDFELALTYLNQYVDEKESVINDRTAKVIKSYDDINKLNRLEQKAQIQKEKADIIEQKKIELDSFFYRIAHDLKGPITSMMSLSYVAKLELKDSTSLKFLEEYENQANRLNTILDGLLNLTKMSFNEDVKQDIDFEKIINDCISSYKFLANYELVEFQIDVDSNIKFKAEWALINIIIQNLIENGIKYARIDNNNPQFAISVKRQKGAIEIVSKDNGIGMDAETVTNIFTMFFRANRKIEGTGLGLHILKRAIERLSGGVEVESILEEGSTFRITLPK